MARELWDDDYIIVGDLVRVMNETMVRYRQVGVADHHGSGGRGWYLEFADGEIEYIPFHYERVMKVEDRPDVE